MKIRTRIILSFTLLVGVGFYFLVDWILEDLRPRYLESVEETLVDQANILASLLEVEIKDNEIDAQDFREAFAKVKQRSLQAMIYKLHKTNVDTRVYITDFRGTVIFDSEGKDEGQDFSQWRDVYLTLHGFYGARMSRDEPKNPTTSVMHVAAPIRFHQQIIGVVTLRKPTSNINFFIETAQPNIMIAGALAAISVILLGILLSAWLTSPIRKLTQYARDVRDGRPVPLPRLGRNEMKEMGQAFEEMRVALEGKHYVEQYVQSLTHELKSPLAAVRGAAELMQEDMPVEQRVRFLTNIRRETGRMQELVDRMLKLAELENRRELKKIENFDGATMLRDVLSRCEDLMNKKKISLENKIVPEILLKGEKFLLEQALFNLIQNAISFSPVGGRIILSSVKRDNEFDFIIEDEGPGVPDYALAKVFEKFYSLQRPDTQEKGTGLGLSFVKEIASLHGGRVRLENRVEGGARAVLTLPL